MDYIFITLLIYKSVWTVSCKLVLAATNIIYPNLGKLGDRFWSAAERKLHLPIARLYGGDFTVLMNGARSILLLRPIQFSPSLVDGGCSNGRPDNLGLSTFNWIVTQF